MELPRLCVHSRLGVVCALILKMQMRQALVFVLCVRCPVLNNLLLIVMRNSFFDAAPGILYAARAWQN